MFTLAVHGRAAHAGLDPEKGVSALLELAKQTIRLHDLNNFVTGSTVTVTVVAGGTHSNVVPAEARAEIDMRFSNATEGQRIESAIMNLKPFDERARLIVTGGINRPPLERTDKVVGLYRQAQAVAAGLGMRLDEGATGGGSDGNFTAALGVKTLDGLGAVGDGFTLGVLYERERALLQQ